jgi:hypothetical protein
MVHVVNLLNVSGLDNNRQISSEGYPYSYIGQDAASQRARHERAQFPIIEQITANPDTLWLADKKMVAISLDVAAAPMTGWKIVRVVKNESQYGVDDGYEGPDAMFVGQMLKLRAKRNRDGDARTYIVYVRVYNKNSDGSEASTLATVEVNIPSSHSKGETFAAQYLQENRETLSNEAKIVPGIRTSKSSLDTAPLLNEQISQRRE